MRIGLDVDGVLADFNTSFLLLAEKLFLKSLPRPSDTWPDHWDWFRDHLSGPEVRQVWKEIQRSETFWWNLSAFPHLPTLTIRDDYYFITDRTGHMVKDQTCAWLHLHLQPLLYPTVLLTKEKGLVAKALQLDAFLDDRPENCADVVAWSPQTRTCLLDRPWNRPYQNLGVPVVKSVQEFLEALS